STSRSTWRGGSLSSCSSDGPGGGSPVLRRARPGGERHVRRGADDALREMPRKAGAQVAVGRDEVRDRLVQGGHVRPVNARLVVMGGVVAEVASEDVVAAVKDVVRRDEMRGRLLPSVVR